AIDLVERDHDRLLGVAELARELAVAVRDADDRVEHEQRDVRLGEALPRGLHHALAEQVARLVQPRRVDEQELHARSRLDAEVPVARRVRLRRDDRALGPEDRVEQRRLADVRPADERDEARAVVFPDAGHAPSPSDVLLADVPLGSVGGVPAASAALSRSSRASASRAAACSASFLLPPRPEPSTRPATATWLSKSFAWSGPVARSSVYSGAVRNSRWVSSCRRVFASPASSTGARLTSASNARATTA